MSEHGPVEMFRIDPGLADDMCRALGVPLPGDLDGIGALYRRWCARIPFDPVAKAAALAEGRTPPGAQPAELCEGWLADGLGGTCWGHVSALSAVLAEAGVPSRVALDRMLRDDAIDFHAFLVIDDGGRRLALDLVHPSNEPLPVEAGATGTHPVYRTGFDERDGRTQHWFTHPDSRGSGRYNLLSASLDADDVRAFCEISARFSGVPARSFFHKRVPPDAMVKAKPAADGTALVVRRWEADGEHAEQLEHDDIDEVFAALGYSPAVRRLAERGGLVVPASSPGAGTRFAV